MDMEQRMQRAEQNITVLFDRMGKVEDKASGAWKTIAEQRADVTVLRTEFSQLQRDFKALAERFNNMEVDMKDQKMATKDIRRTLKVLVILVSVIGVISIGFFIYIWRHDAELAKAILSFGATVGKLVA